MVCLHFTIDLWEAGEPDMKSPPPKLGRGMQGESKIRIIGMLMGWATLS